MPTTTPDDVLAGWWMEGRPAREWLADASSDAIHKMLVAVMKRRGFVPAAVAIAEAGELDPYQVYAESFPRRAANAAQIARGRGDQRTSDLFALWLMSGGWCCCCGRRLVDPASVVRGIGPDCLRHHGPLVPADLN
jgi:hypothetical protein